MPSGHTFKIELNQREKYGHLSYLEVYIQVPRALYIYLNINWGSAKRCTDDFQSHSSSSSATEKIKSYIVTSYT